MNYHQRTQRFAAEFGIAETHGVEILRLIHMLSNIYETVMSARARETLTHEISGPRWRLLLHLYLAERQDRASVSPTELSRAQNVTKNTISSLLATLEAQGLIERSLAPHDRRQFQIRLTETGRELIRTSTPAHMNFLNQLVADLTPAEVSELTGLLWKLHGSLARHAHLPSTYCPERESSEIMPDEHARTLPEDD